MSSFAVIYRIYLLPEKEQQYLENWPIVASYFTQKCGAFGSTLHQADDGMWVAYSLWPDRATRDAAWPKEGSAINATFPLEIKQAIANLKECADPLRFLPEITMKIVKSIKQANG